MDTLPIDREQLARRLQALYADQSKHAIYQSLPAFVADALGLQFDIDSAWRGDAVRLRHLLSHAQAAGWPEDGSWCDFGANTGFFSLSLAHQMPRARVLAVEANPNHASFIDTLAQAFELTGLQVLPQAITLDRLGEIGQHEVLLHLNVLHHAGADFDRERVSGVADFGAYAIEYLRRLRANARRLVFQIGSNLWGDKAHPIVALDDDMGKLRLFAAWLAQAGWRIDDLSYATRDAGDPQAVQGVSYRSLPPVLLSDLPTAANEAAWRAALAGLRLQEHPGEFYRRPLFICSHA